MKVYQRIQRSNRKNSMIRKMAFVSLFFLFQVFVFAGSGPTTTSAVTEGKSAINQASTPSKVVAGSGKLTDSVPSDSISKANSPGGDIKPEGENVILQVGISAAVIIGICVLTWMMSSGPKKTSVKREETMKGN